MKKIKYRIGVLSLLLSCLSLMLAILPPCLLDHKMKEIKAIDRVDDAAVSLEIQGVREDFAPLKGPDSQKVLTAFSEKNGK